MDSFWFISEPGEGFATQYKSRIFGYYNFSYIWNKNTKKTFLVLFLICGAPGNGCNILKDKWTTFPFFC